VIADPRAVAERWPDARQRALAEISRLVTETPWALSRRDRDRVHDAGLSDDELLHAIALASFFGHLNRIADVVGVLLDYEVKHLPPPAEPAVPPFQRAPVQLRGEPALAIEARAATAAALASWRDHVVAREPKNLQIAASVAELLGDGDAGADAQAASSSDPALRRLVEQVTLAPWQVDDEALAPLRAAGHDDAALFDACAAATSFGAFSRIRVALVALGRRG
jgi:alkylhydroperoxidase family enzyme